MTRVPSPHCAAEKQVGLPSHLAAPSLASTLRARILAQGGSDSGMLANKALVTINLCQSLRR